jgi:hypothetical protein
MNCCADMGRAVGMPEGRAHHVLDGPRLAVGEFDFDALPAEIRFGTRLGRHIRPKR